MNQVRIAFAAALLLMMAAVDSTLAKNLTLVDSPFTDQALTLIYDPTDGTLSVNSGGEKLSTLIVTRATGTFRTSQIAAECSTILDVSANRIFVLKTAGVSNLNCGTVLPTDMSASELLADLDVDGSLLPSGAIDQYVNSSPHLYVVPEPSTCALLSLAGILAASRCRRRLYMH
ncbi:MAG: PEP-CTERM sorting domain-containing protein [Planctomycetales bacterium]|nr:PEP-CTERM sorting domain-containing protein [Planctomycetales bacterium]MCA9171925.1 PEP-CTERM sorting domain-containing protein [Planctomycetales bacterium]